MSNTVPAMGGRMVVVGKQFGSTVEPTVPPNDYTYDPDTDTYIHTPGGGSSTGHSGDGNNGGGDGGNDGGSSTGHSGGEDDDGHDDGGNDDGTDTSTDSGDGHEADGTSDTGDTKRTPKAPSVSVSLKCDTFMHEGKLKISLGLCDIKSDDIDTSKYSSAFKGMWSEFDFDGYVRPGRVSKQKETEKPTDEGGAEEESKKPASPLDGREWDGKGYWKKIPYGFQDGDAVGPWTLAVLTQATVIDGIVYQGVGYAEFTVEHAPRNVTFKKPKRYTFFQDGDTEETIRKYSEIEVEWTDGKKEIIKSDDKNLVIRPSSMKRDERVGYETIEATYYHFINEGTAYEDYVKESESDTVKVAKELMHAEKDMGVSGENGTAVSTNTHIHGDDYDVDIEFETRTRLQVDEAAFSATVVLERLCPGRKVKFSMGDTTIDRTVTVNDDGEAVYKWSRVVVGGMGASIEAGYSETMSVHYTASYTD